jgi:hypothetical protein
MLTFPRFQVQSASIAQPLIGSFITAGIGTPTAGIPLTITLGNLSENSGQYDNQIFTPGSWAVLIDPTGVNMEEVLIQSIVTGASLSLANQLVLGPKTNVTAKGVSNPVTENPHVSGGLGVGTWILPKIDFNSILVQPEDGNAGAFIFIGNGYNMTANYKRIIKLAKVAASSQPNAWTNTCSSSGNALISSELWVLASAGGQNDAYTVSLNQV